MAEYHGKPIYEKSNVAKYASTHQDGGMWLSKTTTNERGQPQVESNIRLSGHQTQNLREAAPYLERSARGGRESGYVNLDSGKMTSEPGSGVYARVSDDSRYFKSQGIEPRDTHNVHMRHYDGGYPTRDGACLDARNFEKFSDKHLSPRK